MERQPEVGDILGVHTREALHHSKKLLSRTQPNSTVPGPATWVCLYPHPYLALTPLLVSGSGSRKGQPKHLSQPPWLCPFQVLAMLAVYRTTTPPLQPFRK